MLLGIVSIISIAAAALWVNDYTRWGGPEFVE